MFTKFRRYAIIKEKGVFMKRNKWWDIPLSVFGYLAVLAVLYYILFFGEFILFEGSWGGNIIDFFVMLFNSIVYLACSIIYGYFVLPAITDKIQVSKKTAIFLISVLFIILSVVACILITIDSSSDVYHFFYERIIFYWAPITEYVLYYTNQYIAGVCVFIVNAVAPICFMLGIKKQKR